MDDKGDKKSNDMAQGDPPDDGNAQQQQQPGVLPFDQRRRARQQEEPPPPPPADQTTLHPAPSGPKPHPHHRGVSWGDVNMSFISPEASDNSLPPTSPASRRPITTGQEAYEAAEAALQDKHPERGNSANFGRHSRMKLDDLM